MNSEQRKQIRLQLKTHAHKRYEANIVLTKGHSLERFIVYPKVMRPEKMTSVYLARWLFFNNGIYKRKNIMDMGCGSGIQGIVAGLYGAKKVTFSDIDQNAVSNTKENIRRFKLSKKSIILWGDLFENINKKFDVIVFNHPFFGNVSKKYSNASMTNNGQLLHKFLEDCKKFLKKNGVIVMPYFHLAGLANNPRKQAPKHGYSVTERFSIEALTGIQKGPISIYELYLKKTPQITCD